MASAQAQIEVVVKNLNSLSKLDKTLSKLNKTNQELIRGVDGLTRSIDKLAKIQGFTDIAQDAKGAGKEIDAVGKKLRGLDRLLAQDKQAKAALNKRVREGLEQDFFFKRERAIARTVQTGIKRASADVNAVWEALQKGKASAVEFFTVLGALPGKLKLIAKNAREVQEAISFKSKGIDIAISRQSLASLQETLASVKNTNKELSIDNKNYRDSVRDVLFAEKEVNKELLDRKRIVEGLTTKQRAFREKINRTIIEARQRKASGAFTGGFAEFSKRADKIKAIADAKRANTIEFQILNTRKIARKAALRAGALREVQRTKGLDIEQRINRVLEKRVSIMSRIGIGKGANPQGMFASRGGIGGRIRGAGSSALIGGAFPALFGQGGAASIGGGLGGALGGALGGGLGFGLSLVGTVIGQKVQEAKDFQKAIDKLNISIEATGGVSKFAAKDIKELAQNFGITKEEALQAAGAFAQFDAVSRIALTKTFGNQQTFDTLAALKDNQSTLEGIKTLSTTIGIEKAKETLEVLKQKGAYEAQLTLVKEISAIERSKQIDNAKKITTEDRLAQMRKGFGILGDVAKGGKVELLEKSFAEMKADERVQKLIDSFADSDEKARELLKTTKELNKEFEKIAKLKGPEDELAKLLDPVNQLISAATAIGNAFSSSFQGIITGSMSAQQALANFFKQTADSFAKMAADILAAQIRAKIVGMFANAFASSFNPASAIGPNADISGAALDAGRSYSDMDKIMNGGLQTVIGAEGGYWSGGLKPFASGGYATKPTLGLVGEAGEDEYIIPASKMASSMQRYSAGARGEAVIPGTGSSYAGGGAGGSTTVNYSGPILNFNSEQFVPKSAVGEIIATATSQGAKAGENRTLSTLRNSRSARSRLGM